MGSLGEFFDLQNEGAAPTPREEKSITEISNSEITRRELLTLIMAMVFVGVLGMLFVDYVSIYNGQHGVLWIKEEL
jgi:hypothetical protein